MKSKVGAGRIATSEAEMRAALKAARLRERVATKIKSARYDRRGDALIIELSTGATLSIPRCTIPGFARAQPRMLSDLAITPGGEGLWSDMLDDGVLLEQLLILALGASTMARVGARINASKTSPARVAASRANGAKGGRPRKPAA